MTQLSKEATPTIEDAKSPERIWVDSLRGESVEGEWFITTDENCDREEHWTAYVRADTRAVPADSEQARRDEELVEAVKQLQTKLKESSERCVAVVLSQIEKLKRGEFICSKCGGGAIYEKRARYTSQLSNRDATRVSEEDCRCGMALSITI